MNSEQDFFEANKTAWDQRVKSHTQSAFYNLQGFKNGENPLNPLELALLGNISGQSIVHLQCHFGMDTLALARMGATVTGVDFSDEAIETAQNLSLELHLDARFICCNVYDTLEHTSEKYDMVFTSYGTIGWLPDLTRWGNVIGELLKPGGTLLLVDFHPALWMFDNEFKHLEHSYFNTSVIAEEEQGSYAERESGQTATTFGWNHSFGEIFAALLVAGLEIRDFQEYDYSPYACFQNLVEKGERKYQIQGLEGKIPMVYSIVAEKTKPV